MPCALLAVFRLLNELRNRIVGIRAYDTSGGLFYLRQCISYSHGLVGYGEHGKVVDIVAENHQTVSAYAPLQTFDGCSFRHSRGENLQQSKLRIKNIGVIRHCAFSGLCQPLSGLIDALDRKSVV